MEEGSLAENRTPRLSVIIPTLNEAGYLPLLLEALAAQTRPADEIIVADAGSASLILRPVYNDSTDSPSGHF